MGAGASAAVHPGIVGVAPLAIGAKERVAQALRQNPEKTPIHPRQKTGTAGATSEGMLDDALIEERDAGQRVPAQPGAPTAGGARVPPQLALLKHVCALVPGERRRATL